MRRPYLFAAFSVAIAALLFAFAIQADAATVCNIFNGCLGTSTTPAYGQLLIGGKNGEYEFVASSTLGSSGGGSGFSTTSAAYWLTQQTTSNLSEGSNLYFTNARAISALTGQSNSLFTNGAGYLTSLAGAASSTILSDNNTFSGVDIFSNGSSNFSGTWQTHAPAYFQTALGFTPYNATNPSSYIPLTALSATWPLAYNNATGVFSSATSSASSAGVLSAADWTTFNGKQATVSATYPILFSGNTVSTALSSSTLTASSPLTGSFAQVGSGGLLGCQTASGSQGGCLASADWTTFNNKQYAFSTSTLSASSPLTGSFIQVGSGGTLGIQAASASQAGSESAASYSIIHTATSTFSAPLSYSFSTNAVTCPTCNTSSASVTSIASSNGISGGTITTSGTLSLVSYLATSSSETDGQIPYWTTTSGNPAKLGSVATSSLGVTSPITFSGTPGAQIGGVGGTFGCATCLVSNAGDWAGTWQTYSPSHFQVAGSYLTADPFWVFTNSAVSTSTPVLITASTTIGNGTQAGGLTISGGATTTGNVLINTGATGTTTLQIGQATNPACVVSEDTGGAGVTYTWWKAGIMYVSTTGCT